MFLPSGLYARGGGKSSAKSGLFAKHSVKHRLNDGLVIALSGAAPADGLGAEFDLAAKIDAFTALRADNPLAFIAGELFRREFYMDRLRLEKLLVGISR